MHSNHAKLGRRNHTFDLLRILFATAVLLAHAPALLDGNLSRELVHRFTHSPMTFGSVSVDGFFLLSGFLIVQSWQRDPHLLSFLQKRVLRIVPGYMVAAVLSTIAVGLLAPGVPHFFLHLGWRFVASLLLLDGPATPPVFPGFHYAAVNGSMWTVPYEFHCYLLVALCGLCRILRRPVLWLAIAVVLLTIITSATLQVLVTWPRFYGLTGEPDEVYRLTATFFIGGCFYLFRHRIKFRIPYALAAAAVLALVLRFSPSHLESALIVFGAYLLFYMAQRQTNALAWMDRVPDISYGIYLYGWPVEALWIWYRHGSPWVAFFVSALLSFVLGWLSWHLVERPMLSLKRRPTAPLPPP